MRRKVISCIILFICLISSTAFAKDIYSTNGRVSFTTSSNWFYTSCLDDFATYGILSVQLDRDTAVMFKQSKDKFQYVDMTKISYLDKSKIRDSILQFSVDGMKQKGYEVYINKTEIFDNAIFIGFTMIKNNNEYKVVTAYIMKNHIMYTITFMGTMNTISEAAKVADTLKIDGIPFGNWNGFS